MGVKVEAQRAMAGRVYRVLKGFPFGCSLDSLMSASGLRVDQVLSAIGFMRARRVGIGCLSAPEGVNSLYHLSESILSDIQPVIRPYAERSGGKAPVSYACKPISRHLFVEVSRNEAPEPLRVLLSCTKCKTTMTHQPLKLGISKKIASYIEAKAPAGLTDVLYQALLADGHARIGDII